MIFPLKKDNARRATPKDLFLAQANANSEIREQAFLEARAKHGEDPPKPPHWGGFALSPESVEFWQGGSHRLHDRFLYERSDPDGWDLRRLYP